jgi:hypothetical protein
MAIQPIDLQVLFSRLDQVGKEQAMQKDVPAHNQAIQGNEIAKKTEEQDHSVNQSREVEKGGVPIIKDEHKRGRSHLPQKKGGDKEEKDGPEAEILKDPHLGRNIDITG